MFPEHVETERLDLRRFDAAVELWDAYEHFGRAGGVVEGVRYYTDEPDATPKETFDRLREAEEDWEGAERALYAIYPTDGEDGAGELAGDALLDPKWDRRSAHLGVRLRKPFRGRGYSGERAAALLAVAFDRLDLEVVSAGAIEDDERSRRAIEAYVERFGGRRDGLLRNWVPVDDEVADVEVYSVSREEFEANREAADDVRIHDG